MPVEIERKFLVKGNGWQDSAIRGASIRQAYIANTPNASVRVRIINGQTATITTKLPHGGISRFEFEHDISVHEAEILMDLREGNVVEKTRYRVPADTDHSGERRVWEIDVFSGMNAGLVIAEIELARETEEFIRPDWLGREVTGQSRYSNSILAVQSYQTWRTREALVQAADPS